MAAGDKGELEEAFGTGTAAVISPIGELNYRGHIVTINDFKTGELTQKLYDTLTGIQWGKVEDPLLGQSRKIGLRKCKSNKQTCIFLCADP